jgi:hypothetical protein
MRKRMHRALPTEIAIRIQGMAQRRIGHLAAANPRYRLTANRMLKEEIAKKSQPSRLLANRAKSGTRAHT